MLKRVIAILTLALLAACGRSGESKLLGAWQWTGCDDAGDIAFSKDHTFRSRDWAVTYSTQPPVLMDSGEWHIRRDRLVMDFKGETRAADARHTELPFAFFDGDTFVVRTTDGRVNTFQRLK
jgi:hypothetical protein